jgi:Zn finger protein HypA/HybF involved in hydrogenase expression
LAVTALCWCPRCQTVREIRISPTLGLVICPACDGAFALAELQEAAYASGYEDALAEATTTARGGRRS